MKYKVGDKVKVRSDLEVGEKYGTSNRYNGHMAELSGKAVTIKKFTNEEEAQGYTLIEDRYPWQYIWTDEMFEGLVKEDKTMFASELMELARKEPEKYEGKRYKVVSGSKMYSCAGREGMKEFTVRHGEFIANGGRCSSLMIYPDTVLEEIPQPVSFMEAVKAYSEGKTIRCGATVYGTQFYTPSNIPLDDELRSQGGYIRAKEILHGEWYIEA